MPPAAPRSPFVVESRTGRRLQDLEDQVSAGREQLAQALLVHGALLFRGFEVESLEAFDRVVTAFAGSTERFSYAGGASPRNALGGKAAPGVYSSTEYPAHMSLSLHNELSYAAVHPERLFFFCVTAPEVGGETTLGDSRRILGGIDPALLDQFRRKGLRYVRTLSADTGSGYSWQDAFETDDERAAEEGCGRIGAEFEWRPGGVLRVSQVRPATAVHPLTREEVWFNQAEGFHPSALPPETYGAFLAFHGSEDGFRLNVTYGDGEPIALSDLEHIRSVLREETVPHPWRRGDILVLDNLLAAHGRAPFSGPRKIALAMT
jgi:alpha-ketoglutarate-dependent taurine dioxygenase